MSIQYPSRRFPSRASAGNGADSADQPLHSRERTRVLPRLRDQFLDVKREEPTAALAHLRKGLPGNGSSANLAPTETMHLIAGRQAGPCGIRARLVLLSPRTRATPSHPRIKPGVTPLSHCCDRRLFVSSVGHLCCAAWLTRRLREGTLNVRDLPQ